jgi:hypothetical protein
LTDPHHVSVNNGDDHGKTTNQRPLRQTGHTDLERLHGELGGKILENRQEAESLGEQMQHVEAVVKMLDPGYNLARIAIKRRTANPWFKRARHMI